MRPTPGKEPSFVNKLSIERSLPARPSGKFRARHFKCFAYCGNVQRKVSDGSHCDVASTVISRKHFALTRVPLGHRSSRPDDCLICQTLFYRFRPGKPFFIYIFRILIESAPRETIYRGGSTSVVNANPYRKPMDQPLKSPPFHSAK